MTRRLYKNYTDRNRYCRNSNWNEMKKKKIYDITFDYTLQFKAKVLLIVNGILLWEISSDVT